MRYFHSPETLNELESQFNDLLNQYEYRSGKNASIIEEIRTEYKQVKRQMKQKMEAAEKAAASVQESANFERAVENYNTDLKAFGQHVGQTAQQKKDDAERNGSIWYVGQQNGYDGAQQSSVWNDQNTAQQNSGGRNTIQPGINSQNVLQQNSNRQNTPQQGSSLNPMQQGTQSSSKQPVRKQNHISGQSAYNAQMQQPLQKTVNKEEEQDLLVQCKENITSILKEAARNRNSDTYKMFEDVVFTNDDEDVTRWFNMHTDNLASRARVSAYDDVRRRLENEFRDAAQGSHLEETYMLKMEKLFGAFIKKKFIEYQILYKDYDDSEQEEDQSMNKRLKKRGYILGVIMGVLIFSIGCFFGVIGTVIGLICAVAAAAFIGKTYYEWRVPEEE